MSELEEASDVILEGASEVAEGVSDIVRGFSGFALSSAFVVGASVGSAVAYFVTKRHLETKYSEQAAEEVAEMRQHYNSKFLALDQTAQKAGIEDLSDLVRERGYAPVDTDADEETDPGNPPSVSPPMAVTPPAAVVEAAQEVVEVPAEPEAPVIRNVFAEAEFQDDWNWDREKANRSPVKPYVIHIDEREEFDSYDGVTWTYFEDDDVLSNERDEIVAAGDRERLVGEKNLEKFGHGSNDGNLVYVRNDELEMIFEIVRSPNSYTEEVQGFHPELRHSARQYGRQPFDDER